VPQRIRIRWAGSSRAGPVSKLLNGVGRYYDPSTGQFLSVDPMGVSR